MLAVDNLAIGFGGRSLFSGLSFVVRPGERLALAGANGAGKSTLLKILTGKEEPDGGKITKGKTFEIGYLPQEGVTHAGRTLYAEAETAFQAALRLQGELDALGERLGELEAGTEEYGAALEEFGELQLRLDAHDVSKMRPRIARVLGGLGFAPGDHGRDTSEFSGGWQMRIALAKLLLREPDLLLLDEPTNHLDIESVMWLESYLKSYPGAVILISHDRRLLDELTNRTLAFEHGRVESYSGNYSFYLAEREARRQQLERAYRNQQKEIAKTEALIDRFRAKATKASMVQSRIKQLDKMERIELEHDAPEVNFRFPQPPPTGQKVLVLEGLTKSYGGGEPVLRDLSFTMEKGDKIAIVGVNGAGKSTFARVAAGVEPFDSGTREEGYHVDISYFAQDHADALEAGRTVLESAMEGARGQSESEVRGLLGCFLFRGDDVFKQVSVLSGGERSRLALARMLMTPANTLIMDEPTNHLDMLSQDVLRRALGEFTGNYFIVSHNRDFLDPIVNKVLEFVPGRPPLTYYGNVTDYLQKKRADEERGAKEGVKTGAGARGGGGGGDGGGGDGGRGRRGKEKRRREAEERQAKSKALRPLQERLRAVEAEIAGCESTKAEIGARMGDPAVAADGGRVKELAATFRDADSRLQRAYTEWAEVSEEIERLGG